MRKVRLTLRAKLIGTQATSHGVQFDQLTEVPRTLRLSPEDLVEWLGDRLEEAALDIAERILNREPSQ